MYSHVSKNFPVSNCFFFQSESVDLKAEIHGGWTMENSKQALNEFLQKMRQPNIGYNTHLKEANNCRYVCISRFISNVTSLPNSVLLGHMSLRRQFSCHSFVNVGSSVIYSHIVLFSRKFQVS